MDDSLVNDEILNEFITESREHLVTIEADLLVIESGGAAIDEPLVNKVFRAAHSIKGGSGFFGLIKIKELAHKAETVLDMIRSRKIVPNAEVVNVLLAAFDQLRDMINNIAESEKAGISDLLVSLTGLASSYLPPGEKASLLAEGILETAEGDRPLKLPQSDIDRVKRNGQEIYWVDCDLIHDIEKNGLSILSIFKTLSANGDILDCEIDYEAVGTLEGPVGNRVPLRLIFATFIEPDYISSLLGNIELARIHRLVDVTSKETAVPEPRTDFSPLVEMAPAIPSVPEQPMVEHPAVGQPASAPPAVSACEDTLRVNVNLLENLMNLAGELVLSRNQLRSAVAQNNRQLLVSVDQRVNQVTSEIQEVIMQTRLQPIGNVFAKFTRLVRDLSRSLGKEIQLDIIGKDIALDKTLIEGLSDPLTHMVRNSVDHGIETTVDRLRAGKKPVGTVRIEARHEAGLVVVEIADDGKGIDPDKVTEAAIRKGLISADKAQGLSVRDKQALIFLPGLSTAKVVSDVSGRGVGMDVVKTNLDHLGGQVEILSEPGKGSTFRIKLPLTLAIIPSLIISVENERFAIPQANIEELIRLRPEEVKTRIEIVGDSEVLLLRDRMLPLARFADLLGTVPSYSVASGSQREIDRRARLADRRSARHVLDGPDYLSPADSGTTYERTQGDRRRRASSALEIAVVTTGTMSYGLVVGSFHDTEEVVVKPLGRRLKHLREYSGATILGDGAVALILDVTGVAAKAGLSSVSGSARAAELAAEAEALRLQDVQSLLLFNNGPDEPCAISLDIVQRIEHIAGSQIERLGKNRTMQYRGHSLPLVTLSDAASLASLDAVEDLIVLVSSVNGREVGLLVTLPVDVVEMRSLIDQNSHRQKGIAGSTILRGKTTLIADLYELVDTVHPEWVAARSEESSSARKGTGKKITLLLAEDSDFFRSQMKKYLEDDGCTVFAACDGEDAWDLLLKNIDTVSAVVTDIEMPRLSGLGLASRIRADVRTAKLPIIAVTSLAGDDDAARGKAAGITEYQVKLDRDKLLSSIHAYVR